MKFVDLSIRMPKAEVLEYISDSKTVNDKVRFDTKAGTPFMHVSEKDGKLKIKCEMMDLAYKDNEFIQGTSFRGKITESNGETRIKGIITTEPIYHIICSLIVIVAIVFSFFNAAMISVPILFLASEFIFLSSEFKKQGYIQRYLARAIKRLRDKNGA